MKKQRENGDQSEEKRKENKFIKMNQDKTPLKEGDSQKRFSSFSSSSTIFSPGKSSAVFLEEIEKTEMEIQTQVVRDTEEAIKTHKTLVSSVVSKFQVNESLAKFSRHLENAESRSKLVNTLISDHKELKIEAFSPIEILRRYSSTEFQKVAQIMKKFPEGIYLIDFMLINFHVLLSNSEDLLFLLHGSKELFRLIVQRSSRLAYPLLKKYIYNAVLTEKETKEVASVRSTGVFSDIQEERFICEKVNWLMHRNKLEYDQFILANMGSTRICFDDFFSFFMNVNGYAFDSKAMLKSLQNKPEDTSMVPPPPRLASLNSTQIHERNKDEIERIPRMAPITNGLHPVFHKRSLVQVEVIKECETLVSLEEHGTVLWISSARTLKSVLQLELNPIYRKDPSTFKEILKVCYSPSERMLGCTTNDGFMSFWMINQGFRVDDAKDTPIVGSFSISTQENALIKGGFEFAFCPSEVQTNIWYFSLLGKWVSLSLQNELFVWDVLDGYKTNQSAEKVWRTKGASSSKKHKGLKEDQNRFISKLPKFEKIELKSCGKISDVFEVNCFDSLGIATFDKEVLLYSVSHKAVSARIPMKTSSAFKVMFCESLSLLIPCCFNSSLTLLTLEYSNDSTTASILKGHMSSLTAVELFDDLQVLVTVDETHFIKLWDLQQFRCKQTFQLSSHSKIICVKRVPESPFCLVLTNRINLFRVSIDIEASDETEVVSREVSVSGAKEKKKTRKSGEGVFKEKELFEKGMGPARVKCQIRPTIGFENEIILQKNNAFLAFALETGNIKSILDKHFLSAFREFKMSELCWIGDPLKHILLGTTSGYLILSQYFHPEETLGSNSEPFYPFYNDIQKTATDETSKPKKDETKEISKDKIAALVRMEISNKKFSALKHIRTSNDSKAPESPKHNEKLRRPTLPLVSIILIKYVPRDSNLIVVGDSQVSVVTLHQFKSFELVRNVRFILRTKDLSSSLNGDFGIISAEFLASSDQILLLFNNKAIVALDYLTFNLLSVFFAYNPEKIRDIYFGFQRRSKKAHMSVKMKGPLEHNKTIQRSIQDDLPSLKPGESIDDEGISQKEKNAKSIGTMRSNNLEIGRERGGNQAKGNKQTRNKNLDEIDLKKVIGNVDYERFLDHNAILGEIAQQLNDMIVDSKLGLGFVFNGSSKVFVFSLRNLVLVETAIVPDEIIQNNNGVVLHSLISKEDVPLSEFLSKKKSFKEKISEESARNSNSHSSGSGDNENENDSSIDECSEDSNEAESATISQVPSIRASSAVYFLVFSNANGNVYLLPFDMVLESALDFIREKEREDGFFGKTIITSAEETEPTMRSKVLEKSNIGSIGSKYGSRDPYLKMMIQYDEMEITSKSLESLLLSAGSIVQMIEELSGQRQAFLGTECSENENSPKGNRSIVKFSKQEIIGLRGPHSSRVDDIVFHNFRGKKLLMVVFSDGAMKIWDLLKLAKGTEEIAFFARNGYSVKDLTQFPAALNCRMNLQSFMPFEWSLVWDYNQSVIHSLKETFVLIRTLMTSVNLLPRGSPVFSQVSFDFDFQKSQMKSEKVQESLEEVSEKDDSDSEETKQDPSSSSIPKNLYLPASAYQDVSLQHLPGRKVSYAINQNNSYVKEIKGLVESLKEEIMQTESSSGVLVHSSIFQSHAESSPSIFGSIERSGTKKLLKKSTASKNAKKNEKSLVFTRGSHHASMKEQSTMVSKQSYNRAESKRTERSIPNTALNIKKNGRSLPQLKLEKTSQKEAPNQGKQDFISYFYSERRGMFDSVGQSPQAKKFKESPRVQKAKKSFTLETAGSLSQEKRDQVHQKSFIKDIRAMLTLAKAGKSVSGGILVSKGIESFRSKKSDSDMQINE